MTDMTPVAWIANDGSAVHLSYWIESDIPLYTADQLRQARADALREAAKRFGGNWTMANVRKELRRMAEEEMK